MRRAVVAGAKKESKTARASVRAGAGGAGATRVFGDMKRFTPLGGGYCYHYAADGRTLHVKVDSEELFTALSSLEGSDRAKVEAEIAGLATQFPQIPAWAALRDKLATPAAAEETVAA
jgi:hypothetical protein